MADWAFLLVKIGVPFIALFLASSAWRSLRKGETTGLGSIEFNRSRNPIGFWLVMSFEILMIGFCLMLISDAFFGLDVRFWL